MVVLVTLPCTLSAPTTMCKIHTSSELHQKWMDFYNTRQAREAHESIYITPPFTNFIRDLQSTTDTMDSHLFGDQECPTQPATDDVSVQQRSICPWYNVLNKDQRRYPSVLTEARCKCDRCIGVDGLSHCEPVYYNVHALHLTEQCDDAGYYKWQSGWVKISVGCTCALRPTV